MGLRALDHPEEPRSTTAIACQKNTIFIGVSVRHFKDEETLCREEETQQRQLALEACLWFRGWSSADVRYIASEGERLDVAPGQMLAVQDAPATGVFVITSGIAQLKKRVGLKRAQVCR